jgi:hypothetical protein
MLDLSMNDEDYAVNSTVRWAKGVAIISVLTSLVVAAPRPAAAQQVCGAAGTYFVMTGMVASGTVVVTGAGQASGFAALACGNGALASGDGTVAVGGFAGFNSNDAGNVNNTFIGKSSANNVVGFANVAIGELTGSRVKGSTNIAIGQSAGSQVTGSANSAVGPGSGFQVNGASNVAFGRSAGAFVTGNNNVAIGSGAGSGTPARALGDSNTVAIGNEAVASADGGVAIGNGAQATRANQLVLGTAKYTYSIPGIASAESRAAQTGPVQIVTSDAYGNLVTNTAAGLELATKSDLSAINSLLATIESRLRELDGRLKSLAR